jgi:hypothetical protein
LAGALLFDEKIRQSTALFWFGLQDVGILYSGTVIQRTIDVSPAFLEHGSTEKIVVLSTCKPRSKIAGGWIHFCMKQLKTLNSYQIFKIKN